MGTDIHVFFERQVGPGQWEPIWIRPGGAWADEYVYQKVMTGAVQMMVPPLPDEPYPLVQQEEYFWLSRRMERYMEDNFQYFWDTYKGERRFSCYMRPNQRTPRLLGTLPDDRLKGYYVGNWCDFVRYRNYDLFAFLAKVRGNDQHSYSPRGLPDDLTEYTRKSSDYFGSDGHTRSWLMVSELFANPVFMERYTFLTHWFNDYIAEPERTRMVFWFDS